jgi:chaperonin GroEL (HSP60 family)
VADSVTATLGPKGTDKLLVDDLGEVTVTNDGATVLSGMAVDDPAAELVVEVAGAQSDAVGDGTTTAVAVAGALLGEAEDLLDDGIHPTSLVRGFDRAGDRIRTGLDDVAVGVDPTDEAFLRRVATTAMTGTRTAVDADVLADLVVRAVRRVTVAGADGTEVDLDALDVRAEGGGSVSESELVAGAVVDRDPVHPAMPGHVDDAAVLLLDKDIKMTEADTEGTLIVDDPAMLRSFVAREDEQLRELVDDVLACGANVVFCQNGIDELAHEYLADRGVLAVRRVRKDEIEFLADLLDARLVGDFDTITPEDVASGTVTRDEDADRFVVEGPGHGATLLLRGSTGRVREELERCVEDALDVVAAAVESGRVVAGGGAVEVELARRLRTHADAAGGREGLAVAAVADALEAVPRALAANAGLDPVDALVALRAAHADGETRAGLDVDTGEAVDALDAGVVEPTAVKRRAYGAAVEAAGLVLRIDDILAADGLSTTGDPEERLPGGAL